MISDLGSRSSRTRTINDQQWENAVDMFLSATTDKRRQEQPKLEEAPQSPVDEGGPQPSHIASRKEKMEWNARKNSVLVTRLAPGGSMWGFQCKPCMNSGRIVITEAKHD